MPRLGIALTLAALALLLPSAAAAKPRLCNAGVVQQSLIDAGKLTANDVGFGVVVDLVRCGDITGDGHADALFTLASGGTAGDTRFGVFRGNADGTPGALVLWRPGYVVDPRRLHPASFA